MIIYIYLKNFSFIILLLFYPNYYYLFMLFSILPVYYNVHDHLHLVEEFQFYYTVLHNSQHHIPNFHQYYLLSISDSHPAVSLVHSFYLVLNHVASITGCDEKRTPPII